MKKVIYIFTAAALLAACDNPLEYKPDNTEDQLIMNGMLSVGESWHEVSVGVSHTEYVSQVKTGELRCYVNGTLVAKTATLVEKERYGESQGKVFRFQADFKAGDTVRLEVDADGRFSASNEQVVPEAPVIGRVDTVSVQKTENGYTQGYLRFDISLSDPDPEEDNFWRIRLFAHNDAVYYKDDAEAGRQSADTEIYFYTEDDPILNEGHFDSAGYFEIGATNYYGVVTDNMFSGASATVRPVADKSSLTYFGYVEGADRAESDCSVKLCLSSLSKPFYYYLRALNMLRGGSSDMALEDVQIPDNIEGGIGFVGIDNPAYREFYIGKFDLDFVFYE